MIADIFGIPVVTVNSTDGPAYGAAIMAASGVLQVGIYQAVKIGFTLQIVLNLIRITN